jgi:DNA sulfur modification protein DndD
MRIEKIRAVNYRQLKNLELSFPANGNDLAIIIGRNKAGKTNILNAINWCLYGDEPHLSLESNKLPLPNLESIQAKENLQLERVNVELTISADDKKEVSVSRTGFFSINKENKRVVDQGSELTITIPDEEEGAVLLADAKAENYVERLFPKNLREFFFFDGERLDRYFREETPQKIRHAVFEISQIDLLQAVEQKLGEFLNDLRREAGRTNPKIDQIQKTLEEKNGKLTETEQRLGELTDQFTIAKDKIKELEEKLRGIPDVNKLQSEIDRLASRREEKTRLRNDKVRDKQDALFEGGMMLMVWKEIQEAIELIKEKKRKREIPPTIDTRTLENIIKDGSCHICGRDLDKDAEKKLRTLLDEIRVTAEIGRKLLLMENGLAEVDEKGRDLRRRVTALTKELDLYDRELQESEKQIDELRKRISGYDAGKVADWYNEYRRFEHARDQCQKNVVLLQVLKKSVEADIARLSEELRTELKKESRFKILKRQLDFCGNAHDVTKKTKQIIMDQTRHMIEEETKRTFFDLIWDKDTYGNVGIDENYSINLIHTMGYECLGTTSAAERELLALAFTLALHTVSNFNAPIFIDTPVARVDDVHREAFARIFEELGKKKQIVLLFTPTEYSKEISATLDSKSHNRYELKRLADETKIEVLRYV